MVLIDKRDKRAKQLCLRHTSVASMGGSFAHINHLNPTLAPSRRSGQIRPARLLQCLLKSFYSACEWRRTGDAGPSTLALAIAMPPFPHHQGAQRRRQSSRRKTSAGTNVRSLHCAIFPSPMALSECVLAGPDDEFATPVCSEEEHGALEKLTAASTLADPQTIVALLSASLQDFDAEAMALTEPAGAVALLVTEADEECVVAIRPRNATNVTLVFTSFGLGNYGYLHVYDGSTAAVLATLTGDNLPQAVTSRSGAMLLVLTRDPSDNGGGYTATYRADTATLDSERLEASGAPSVVASACVAAKRPVSHMCRQCILATIASVCGPRCAQERLHITHDRPSPVALRCLPSLADQLAAEQAGRLEGAVSRLEPFGLSSEPSQLAAGPNLTDLYMPVVGSGQPTQPVVYVGLDSGNRIMRCDPAAFPGLMAVAHSTRPGASSDCAGLAWLDLRTGQARLQLHPSDVGTVPFVIHDIPSECSVVLRSAPPIVGDTLLFAGGASVRTVQCWLMRFFGPQAAPQSVRASQVDFSDGMQTIDLVSDVVIRAGQRLSLSSLGGTLRVGKHQVQVYRGGALEMMRLGVAESEFSSSIVVEGMAAFANSTFVGCYARFNVVSERGLESHGGAIAVMSGGRLGMQHCSMQRNQVRDGIECSGGALLLSASSSAEIVGTELRGNAAIGGKKGSYGGAVRVRGSSSLRLMRSVLARNVADGRNGASFYAYGGAVFIDGGSVGEVRESEIVAHIARGALFGVSAGAIYVEGSRLGLTMSNMNRNVAECGAYALGGGAVCAQYSAVVEIVACELLANVVRGGQYANGGETPNVDIAFRPCDSVAVLSP